MFYNRRYNFAVSPFFLGVLYIIIILSDIFSGSSIADGGEIPGLFFDLPARGYLTVSFSVALLTAVVITLYRLNETRVTAGRSSLVLVLLYLLLVSSSPGYLSYPQRFFSALMVSAALYYSNCRERSEKELFLANFFISAAALTEPLTTLLIPVIFYFSLRSSSANARSVTTALTGVILPFLFSAAILYLLKGEVGIFKNILSAIGDPHVTFPLRGKLYEIVFTMALSLYLIFSIGHILKRINRFKVIKSKYFARVTSLMVIMAFVSIFCSSESNDATVITAIPASFAAAEYSASDNSSPGGRVLLLVVLILLTLVKISGNF